MSTHWFGVQRREYQRWQPTAARFDWLYDVKRALAPRVGVGGDLRQRVINRYDNSVLQADATIERLFAVLAEKGYLGDAVVAIVADHGEALGERGEDYYGHGMDLYQELIRIPILFRDTRGAGDFGALPFATLSRRRADAARPDRRRDSAGVGRALAARGLTAGAQLPRSRASRRALALGARRARARGRRARRVGRDLQAAALRAARGERAARGPRRALRAQRRSRRESRISSTRSIQRAARHSRRGCRITSSRRAGGSHPPTSFGE